MATVIITEKLKEDISNIAKIKLRASIEVVSETFPADVGQRLYDRFFAAYEPIIAQLPSEYFEWSNEISISGRINFYDDKLIARSTDYARTFDLRKKFPKPIGIPSGIKCLKKSWRGWEFSPIEQDSPADIVNDLSEWARRVYDAKQPTEAFMRNLDALLDKHKSLSPALREWPPLWDLLPEKAKDRHRSKTEARKKTKAEADDTEKAEVDLNAMTAIYATTRM
jgi:hypothetical protein